MTDAGSLVVFLAVIALFTIAWGRINRIGYSKPITAIVYSLMNYSKMNTELLRAYLVWSIYMFVGVAASVSLLVVYRIDLLRYFTIDSDHGIDIALAFLAQNSLTGLSIAVLLVVTPGMDLTSEISNVPWIKYTLLMPRKMLVLSPLAAAVVEEIFFRGVVFLILVIRFPELGIYWPIAVCTCAFAVQQALQTDTFGQAAILVIGSVSISVVGCIVTLATASFIPTLLCHAAYAVFYLRLGSSLRKGRPQRGAKLQATF